MKPYKTSLCKMMIFYHLPVVQGHGYLQALYPDIGEFWSPIDIDGDGQYDHNQDLLWELYASENKVLTIYITYMEIQWGENCEFDSLQVSFCLILLLWAYTGEKNVSLTVCRLEFVSYY